VDSEPDWGGESERTIVRTQPARRPSPQRADWRHSLVVVQGLEPGRRVVVGESGLSIGRRAPAQLVIAEPEVSSLHCSVHAIARRDSLRITDHQSTNGCFVDGRRVKGTANWSPGSILQVGSHLFRHDFEPAVLADASIEAERDLEKAGRYMQALLPPPLHTDRLITDWHFQPSARLGGDGLGYQALDDHRFAFFILDTCGHGVGSAMHTASVLNVLRQRALTDTDFSQPAQVLSRLNAMFDMDQHNGLYFTLWYGVFDDITRELRLAAAGHHPAFLKAPDNASLRRLGTRNPMVGVMPGARYQQDSAVVAPGSCLYLFSDGIFEFSTPDGRDCGLDDFEPVLQAMTESVAPGFVSAERLFRGARQLARSPLPEDDCSVLVVTFLT
jgi:serine phosphatase RsbU (regulator of sigma subunit)